VVQWREGCARETPRRRRPKGTRAYTVHHMKPSLLVLNRYSYTHILAHAHMRVYYVHISVYVYVIHNVYDRIRVSAACVCVHTHAKGRRACLCALACGRHLFLSLRCVYVRHRCKAGSAEELAGGRRREELARTTTTNTAGFGVLRCG